VEALEGNNLESILTKAKEMERKYDWLQAINIYEEALNSSFCKNDVLEAAEFQEKIGFCLYRAAMQAKSNIEFKKLIKKSIIAYEKEAEILEKANEKEHRIKIAHAHASVAYVKSWCETEAKKRKELLDQWWILENKVLEAHESMGTLASIGKTCNDLSEYSSYNIFWLVSNFSELLKMYMEGIELAERAIKIFDKLNDKFELARAYWIASWYLSFSDHFWEDENKAISLLKKAQDYADKALTLSKEIDDAYLIGKCYYASWTLAQILHFEPKLAVKLGEIAIKYCNISKDNHLIGGVKSLTALSILHLSKNIEDPDKQKEMVIKAIEMAQQATNYFIVINEIAGLNLTYLTQSTSLLGLAEIETNNEKKQEILEKALQVSQEGLERTRDWKRIAYIFASLSEILPLLSEFKTESDEKRELLNEAKMYCKKSQKITEEFMPFLFSYNSFGYYQLAVILDKLATIETQNMKKTKLLAQAATSIKKSLELLQKKQKMLQSEWASGRFLGYIMTNLVGLLKKLLFKQTKRKGLQKQLKPMKMLHHISEKQKCLHTLLNHIGT